MRSWMPSASRVYITVATIGHFEGRTSPDNGAHLQRCPLHTRLSFAERLPRAIWTVAGMQSSLCRSFAGSFRWHSLTSRSIWLNLLILVPPLPAKMGGRPLALLVSMARFALLPPEGPW